MTPIFLCLNLIMYFWYLQCWWCYYWWLKQEHSQNLSYKYWNNTYHEAGLWYINTTLRRMQTLHQFNSIHFCQAQPQLNFNSNWGPPPQLISIEIELHYFQITHPHRNICFCLIQDNLRTILGLLFNHFEQKHSDQTPWTFIKLNHFISFNWLHQNKSNSVPQDSSWFFKCYQN